jgi:hypothetical protein
MVDQSQISRCVDTRKAANCRGGLQSPELEAAAVRRGPLSTRDHLDDLDKQYLEARAETEISLAQAAAHPAVVRAHYLLAGFYLDRLYCVGDDRADQQGRS